VDVPVFNTNVTKDGVQLIAKVRRLMMEHDGYTRGNLIGRFACDTQPKMPIVLDISFFLLLLAPIVNCFYLSSASNVRLLSVHKK